MDLSCRNGWLSVNQAENLNRKNAPEVSKLPMNPEQKQYFKPTWMHTLPKTGIKMNERIIPTAENVY
jgi:hypothetical protein